MNGGNGLLKYFEICPLAAEPAGSFNCILGREGLRRYVLLLMETCRSPLSFPY